jgi:hypothetical protein
MDRCRRRGDCRRRQQPVALTTTTAAIRGCWGGDPPSSDARPCRCRDWSGWPPALRVAWGGAGGGSPCRTAADAVDDDADNNGHIDDVRADGIVFDNGDDDDLGREQGRRRQQHGHLGGGRDSSRPYDKDGGDDGNNDEGDMDNDGGGDDDYDIDDVDNDDNNDGLTSAVPPIRGNNQLMSTVWGGVGKREGRFWGTEGQKRVEVEVIRWRSFHLHSINSKSTFCPPQSRRGTITYSACVLGVRLHYQCHGKHVVTRLKWASTI